MLAHSSLKIAQTNWDPLVLCFLSLLIDEFLKKALSDLAASKIIQKPKNDSYRMRLTTISHVYIINKVITGRWRNRLWKRTETDITHIRAVFSSDIRV